MPPISAKQPNVSRPHVEPGDEIYFHHKGTPYTGKVLAHGEHGCTVEFPKGGRCKVRWDSYAGHRKRTQPELSIVDQGEDGFVAKEGPSGRMRYVHDPLDGPEDEGEDLTKAFEPTNAIERLILMRRGQESALEKAIRNRPGLSLQTVTTSTGVQTKRWKRTAQEAPKGRGGPARPDGKPAPKGPPPGHHDAKPGDSVKFKAGDFHGEGKIITHGATGAVIQDRSGRKHQVDWHEIHERNGAKPAREARLAVPTGKPGKAKEPKLDQAHQDHFSLDGTVEMPTDKLKRQKETSPEGANHATKRLIDGRDGKRPKRMGVKVTPDDKGDHVILDGHATHAAAQKHNWSTVPAMVVQPHSTPEEVYKAAGEATEHLKDWLNKGHGLCDQWGYETQKRAPDDVPDADWNTPGGMLFIAPTKGLQRAKEKVEADYGGDWSRLKDAARCTIAVDTIDQVHEVVDKLKAGGMIVAQPMKDRYKGKPAKGGYRDINIIIRAPNGHLTEVQINTKAMMQAKNAGHKDYEVVRSLDAKYGEVEFDDWSPEDQATFRKHDAAMEALYGAAYAKLTGEKA